MKKIHLIFYLLLLAAIVGAEEVPKEVAKNVALNFYYEQTNIPQTKLTVQNEIIVTDAKNEALIYAFNIGENNGFILVTAEDNAIPVIGYATNGHFSNKNLPLAFKDYLDVYKKQVREIKDSKLMANDDIKSDWKYYSKSFDTFKPKAKDDSKEDVMPLLGMIKWDQGEGWNDMSPIDSDGPGGRAYAGCVATATAMIMKYYSYPDLGTGYHQYSHTPANGYDNDYATLRVTYEGTTYDWEAMPNDVPTAETAKLLFHIGVGVEMNFSADGSGAYTTNAVHVLKKYFGYSPKAIYVARSNYDDVTWKNMMIKELLEKRPILHSGYGESGGHAFVCDGVSGGNYFHFNWGWSGYANGNFIIDALNPGSYSFNEDHSASFGIEPAKDDYNFTLIQQDAMWPGSSRGITMIKPVDNNIAWAIPFDGSNELSSSTVLEFAKTTDGGATWASKNLGISTGLSVSMIAPLDENNAWLAVFKEDQTNNEIKGGIYKTSNGGERWDYFPGMYTDPSSFANVIHFFNANEGFCQGDPINGEFECYYTTDGGTYWIPVSGSNLPNPLSTEEYGTTNLVSVVDDVAYFSTNLGRVFKSVDKGKSWTAYQTPSSSIGAIEFSTVDYGIVSDTKTSGVYYVTEDGALTWKMLEYSGKIFNGELSAVPGAPGVFFSASGNKFDSGSSYSFDGGKTWSTIPELSGVQCLAIGFSDIATGWVGTFNTSPTMGGFMKFTGKTTIVDFVSDERANCVERVVSFEDKSYSVNDIAAYTWNFGEDATPQTASGAGPHEVTYSVAGMKTVKLELTDNYDNTFAFEQENYVEIIDLPIADFSYVIGGNTIDFTNLSTEGLNYYWSFGDGHFSTDYHTRNVYGANDTYTITMKVFKGGCEELAQQNIEMTTVSIDDFSDNIVKSIYPNPVKDYLFVESVLKNSRDLDIRIFDISGKLIYSNAFLNADGKVSIDVQSFDRGIYFIEISNEGDKTTKRFIKE